MTFDIQEILEILPHRYPFLLIDRITEFEPTKRLVAIKNVTINEPFFQGHFPGYPIMPGVLVVEAMAQAGGIIMMHELPDRHEKLRRPDRGARPRGEDPGPRDGGREAGLRGDSDLRRGDARAGAAGAWGHGRVSGPGED